MEYREEGFLAQGSFGRVFRATRLRDGLQVVIKKVPAASAVENEVRILHDLPQHPNIVQYYDNYTDPASNELCMVMEFADSGDLFQELQAHQAADRPFEEERLWQVLHQVASGLNHLHSRKILHRDLKPQNLLLTDGGKRVLIGDFGLGRVLSSSSVMAATGVGTPLYLAPEICIGKEYNSSADVWSLGCVIYELMALKPPFTAANAVALANTISKARTPSMVGLKYSTELRMIVKSMLEKLPDKRPTAEAILRATSKKFSPNKKEDPLKVLEQLKTRNKQLEEELRLIKRRLSKEIQEKKEALAANEKLTRIVMDLKKQLDTSSPAPSRAKSAGTGFSRRRTTSVFGGISNTPSRPIKCEKENSPTKVRFQSDEDVHVRQLEEMLNHKCQVE